MGRWFGYRNGYPDLCRVWLTSEAEGWYRHVTEATAELKRDFARMRRRQATPREFGLRVRTHPDTLLITARNKMATGMDVTGDTRDISLIGRMVNRRAYTLTHGGTSTIWSTSKNSANNLSPSAGPQRNHRTLARFFGRISPRTWWLRFSTGFSCIR